MVHLCARTVWFGAKQVWFIGVSLAVCSPVPFICNFLISIFGMLCYKSLSKSQVYIYFLHDIFFYFIKWNKMYYDGRIFLLDDIFHSVLFFRESFLLSTVQYIQYLSVVWTLTLSDEPYLLSMTLKCEVLCELMMTGPRSALLVYFK